MNKLQKIAIAAGIVGIGSIAVASIVEINKINKRQKQNEKVKKATQEFLEYKGNDETMIKEYTNNIREELRKYAELF